MDDNIVKALKCLASQDSTGRCYADRENRARIHTTKPLIVCDLYTDLDFDVGELCPFHQDKYGICFEDGECAEWLPKVIDIIARQQAEIERLQIENQSLRGAANSYKTHYEAAKSEAIKEFAESLKRHTRKMSSSDFGGEFWDKAVLVSDIDKLVKEMAGESEWKK